MKKGTRQCAGCMKHFDASNFPKGTMYCAIDKKAINNIYNACKAQNELDWYHAQMDSQERRKRMLDNYQQMCPELPDNKKRKPPCILTMRTKCVTELGIDKTKLGEMMWIGHFTQWAAKPKNGGMDMQDATVDFQRRCQEPDAIVDKEGPKKAPLRVWVKTKDLVGFRNSFLKSKEAEVTEKQQKKATDEDLDKSFAWLQENFDRVGNNASALTLEQTAKNMVAAAAGSGCSWDGHVATLTGNVKDLCPESEQEDEEAVKGMEDDTQDSEDAGLDECDGKTTKVRIASSGKKSKDKDSAGAHMAAKERWFDRDKSVADAERLGNKWLAQTTEALREQLRNIEKVEHEAQQIFGATDANRTSEMVIMANRQKVVRLVLGIEGDPAASAAEVAAWVSQLKSQQVVRRSHPNLPAHEAAAAARARMGQAPPCKSYEQLIDLASMEKMMAKLHHCETKADILSHAQMIKPHRDAIAELLAASKAAARGVESAVIAAKAERKAKCAAVQQRARKNDKASSAATTGNMLFEVAATMGAGLQFIVTDGAQPLQFSPDIPCAFKLDPKMDIFKATMATQTAIKTFIPKFEQGRERDIRSSLTLAPQGKKGEAANRFRAQLPMSEMAEAECMDAVDRITGSKQHVPSSLLPQEVFKAVQVSCFGISRGYAGVTSEVGWLGCFRISFKGTRQVVIVSAVSVMELMRKEKGEGPHQLGDLKKHLHGLSAEKVDELARMGKLFHGTLGEKDALWLPPGMLVCEHVGIQENVIGVRIGKVFYSQASSMKDFEAAVNAFTGKPTSEPLTQAIAIASTAPSVPQASASAAGPAVSPQLDAAAAAALQVPASGPTAVVS